jgi:quinol-cytochrome oxidoreductase complex cytochrome b subunit
VWNVILGLAACVGAVLLLAAAVMFAMFARPVSSGLLTQLLRSGGERKNYYTKVRGVGVALLLCAFLLLLYVIPRGTESHHVHVLERRVGLVAVGLFLASAIVLSIWWLLATMRLNDTTANRETRGSTDLMR